MNKEEQLFWLQQFTSELLDNLDAIQKGQQHRYASEALSYIQKNYSDPNLSLSMLAEHVGSTPSYLSKLIRQGTSKTFNEHLCEVRISEAKKLLATSSMLIKEISDKTGFLSVQNFIRVFKRYVGITPGQYREIRHSDK